MVYLTTEIIYVAIYIEIAIQIFHRNTNKGIWTPVAPFTNMV